MSESKDEVQVKLEEAREFLNGDETKIESLKYILKKITDPIKQKIAEYFSDPNKVLRGLSDEKKAFAAAADIVKETLLDSAVNSSTLEHVVVKNVAEFLDKKVKDAPAIDKTHKSKDRAEDVKALVSKIESAIESSGDADVLIPSLSAELSAAVDYEHREMVDALNDSRFSAEVFDDFVKSLSNSQEVNDVFEFIRDTVLPIANKIIAFKKTDKTTDMAVLVGHDFVTSTKRHEDEEAQLSDILSADESTLSPAEKRLVHRHKLLADKIKNHKGDRAVKALLKKYYPKIKSIVESSGVKLDEEQIQSIAANAVYDCLSRPDVLNRSFDMTVAGLVREMLNDEGHVNTLITPGESMDPEAAEKFIKSHDPIERGFHSTELLTAFMGTLKDIAKKFITRIEPYGVKYEDLVQHGGALVFPNCLAKYDPSKNTKFNTYFYDALVKEFYRIGNYYRAQKRSPHTETPSGEKVSAPGLQQSLESPISQSGEEDGDATLEDTLQAPEEGAAEQVGEMRSAIDRARDMMETLITDSRMGPTEAGIVRRVFEDMVTKGKDYSLTEISKEVGRGITTIQGWAGRTVYPALLFAFGKYGEGKEAMKRVMHDHRSQKGVNLQKFKLMLTDRYDVSQKSEINPVRFYQQTKAEDANDLIAGATEMLNEIPPLEQTRAISQINDRIRRINAEYRVNINQVSSMADIKKEIQAQPATFFNIISSLMDVQVQDIKRLKTAKFSNEEDVRSNADQALLWAKDLLTGYNDSDSKSIAKTMLSLLEKEDGNLRGAFKAALKHNFVASDAFFKDVKGGDVDVSDAAAKICELAHTARLTNTMELEEIADKANDLFLNLSDDDERAFKKAIGETDAAIRAELYNIANSEFSTDSFISAAVGLGISLPEMGVIAKKIIIPMLGGKYEDAKPTSQEDGDDDEGAIASDVLEELEDKETKKKEEEPNAEDEEEEEDVEIDIPYDDEEDVPGRRRKK